ncbi:hypothetical protein [Bacillus timonensis]|uniref:hypothetical protein n=1 Tax=Bacillus timonensis TaxID=1033734 RepID=UPI0002FE7AEA|nr:hypothetical protein [Bacillus timonensis]
MKRLILKAKYYWHSLQFSKNKALLEDCLCANTKSDIQSKMQYHERKAISHLTKM